MLLYISYSTRMEICIRIHICILFELLYIYIYIIFWFWVWYSIICFNYHWFYPEIPKICHRLNDGLEGRVGGGRNGNAVLFIQGFSVNWVALMRDLNFWLTDFFLFCKENPHNQGLYYKFELPRVNYNAIHYNLDILNSHEHLDIHRSLSIRHGFPCNFLLCLKIKWESKFIT